MLLFSFSLLFFQVSETVRGSKGEKKAGSREQDICSSFRHFYPHVNLAEGLKGSETFHCLLLLLALITEISLGLPCPHSSSAPPLITARELPDMMSAAEGEGVMEKQR